MNPIQLAGLVCLLLLCCENELLLSQEPEARTTVQSSEEKTPDHSIIKIVAEPKTSRPFDWKRGERITIGLRCVFSTGDAAAGAPGDAGETYDNGIELPPAGKSSDKVGATFPPGDESIGHTRVVGLATNVELVAIRPFKNRVEMMLRADVETIKLIETAAKVSEFWFEIMPFEEKHREILEHDIDFQEFLTKNPQYRAAMDSDWGYGANPKLQAPTKDELPTRK